MVFLRRATTQPTIGHVPYELLSPITVPDYRPSPNLPNPLSPCNQPPCDRRKSRRAKLDANRAAGFEAARVHTLSSRRTLLVGRIRAPGRSAARLRDARFESAWVMVTGRGVVAARARATVAKAGARILAGRVKIRLTLSPSVVHPPWHCRFVWGQVRMMRRTAFDPPSRQSRRRQLRGSKSADQGFFVPRRRRCSTR